MITRARIKKKVEISVAAMFKEFKQLNKGAVPGISIGIPTDVNRITPKDQIKALLDVNLIKEKRNGIIQRRTSVN